MKTLVTYFSASGVTANTAHELADKINADIFEIQPQAKYTEDDLNWMNKQSRSTLEMNDPNSRPPLADKVKNIDQYQTIFIGFPIWWYIEPRIIDTFLQSYDFGGKTLIPFATSGGSGIAKAEQHMQSLCPSAIWKQGKLLNRGIDRHWLQQVLEK